MNGDLISIPVSYFSLFYHRNQIKEYQNFVKHYNYQVSEMWSYFLNHALFREHSHFINNDTL